MYIKNNINYLFRNDLNILEDCIESVFIAISKEEFNSSKNIIIGTIYRPPNTDIQTFNCHIIDILQKIKCDNKFVYLMGDFNINLLNIDKHVPSTEFLDVMYSNSFIPLINNQIE